MQTYDLEIKDSIHVLNSISPFKDSNSSNTPNFIPEPSNQHIELSPSPQRPKASAPDVK